LKVEGRSRVVHVLIFIRLRGLHNQMFGWNLTAGLNRISETDMSERSWEKYKLHYINNSSNACNACYLQHQTPVPVRSNTDKKRLQSSRQMQPTEKRRDILEKARSVSLPETGFLSNISQQQQQTTESTVQQQRIQQENCWEILKKNQCSHASNKRWPPFRKPHYRPTSSQPCNDQRSVTCFIFIPYKLSCS
jgi:hypothetical protein